MNDSEYRPVRILRDITVAGEDWTTLHRQYPHGQAGTSRGTRTVSVTFPAGMVVDAPSPEERELFDSQRNQPNPAARDIPQHRDGYDIPTSGLARSRKGSARGREIWRRDMVRRQEMERRRRAARDAERAKARADAPAKPGDGEPADKPKRRRTSSRRARKTDQGGSDG